MAPQKRKVSSPTHSSNGHSPSESSPSPLKKKKKPGAVNSGSKDQVRAPVLVHCGREYLDQYLDQYLCQRLKVATRIRAAA